MKEKVHDHILSELKLNEKTNSIFVLTAIVLNFVTLGINSGMSGSDDEEMIIVMVIFALLTLIYGIVACSAIWKGRSTRQLLLEGITKMYKDSKVEGYYKKELLSNYNIRYTLLIVSVVMTGLTSVIVPFILKYLIAD